MRRWLGWFALAVIVGMQAGTVFKPLGTIGETRVADWVDLLTPFAILGCAAMVLLRAGASRGQWVLFGVGGITFTLGHGLHLAANSVSNVADAVVAKASIVHLWDEVVSHYIWYTGLFLVMAAMAWALRTRSSGWGPSTSSSRCWSRSPWSTPTSRAASPWLGIALPGGRGLRAPVAAGRGVAAAPGRGRDGAGAAHRVGRLLATLADGSVFPQFSELGWI